MTAIVGGVPDGDELFEVAYEITVDVVRMIFLLNERAVEKDVFYPDLPEFGSQFAKVVEATK